MLGLLTTMDIFRLIAEKYPESLIRLSSTVGKKHKSITPLLCKKNVRQIKTSNKNRLIRIRKRLIRNLSNIPKRLVRHTFGAMPHKLSFAQTKLKTAIMDKQSYSDIIVKQSHSMKHILFSLLLLCVFVPQVTAQNFDPNSPWWDKEFNTKDSKKKIDTSMLEIMYLHTMRDTILDETKSLNEILQIGNKFSRQAIYPTFRYDSAMLATFPEKYTNRDSYQVSQIFKSAGSNEYIKNLTDKTISATEQINLMDKRRFEEDIPQFQWTILPDTTTIGGYHCQKATAHFRGHTWEAWFTEELGIDNGPWKLNGLPGLILQAQTVDGTHKYDFAGMRDGGNVIFRTDMNKYLMAREKMIKAQKDFAENGTFGLGIAIAGKEKELQQRKRNFYAPLELE